LTYGENQGAILIRSIFGSNGRRREARQF
jgi:hypothetical protein